MKANYDRLFCILILITFTISGCWDVSDIDRRTTVIALGLDAAPKNQVIATVQIPIIDTSPIRFGGQTSQKPFSALSSQAQTALGAALGIEAQTSKNVFWGQMKCILINTALAQRGLKKYCQFVERYAQISPLTFVALTESSSQATLSVDLGSNRLPGMVIYDYFQSKNKVNQAFPIEIWRLVRAFEVMPTEAYLPIIAYDNAHQTYSVKEIGVFHRDRLVGKLSDTEARMAGIVMGKPIYDNFSVPIGTMGEITYSRVVTRSKISIVRTHPHIKYLVKVSAKGFAPSITSDPIELNPREIRQIERASERIMAKDIGLALRQLQHHHSDIIGFGDQIRANKPAIWKKLNWETEYPHVTFQVRVKFQLEQVGKYR